MDFNEFVVQYLIRINIFNHANKKFGKNFNKSIILHQELNQSLAILFQTFQNY